MDQENWLDTAVSGIRFGPDRRAVREELEGHIEDKAADLMRIFPDIPDGEARERALAGMGDPEALKISLARVHKPWLGRLWVLSCLTLVPAAAVALVMVVALLVSLPDWEAREVIFGRRDAAWSREVLNRSRPATPDPNTIRVDDCLLTMERAWLVEGDSQGEDDTLQVGLRLLSPRIWVEEHYFYTRVSAVDSLGNRYAAEEAWDWINRPKHWVSGSGSPPARSVLPRLFTERYILRVGGVDRQTEWVRLEYDWMGRSFSMTVDLKEAGI